MPRRGGTQPEAERRRKVVSVRLSPEARQALGALESRWECPRARVVERALLEAFDGPELVNPPREPREGG